MLSHYVALAIQNHTLGQTLAQRVSENLRLLASLHGFYDNALEAFATAIDVKHVNIHGHSLRVGRYSQAIGEALGMNREQAHFLVNKLVEVGAVQVAEGSFGTRVLLADHLKLEELEGHDLTPSIEEELAAFKVAQAQRNEQLGKLFEKDHVDEEKKSLQEDLAAKLADPSKRKKTGNPLDAMFKKKL